MFFNAAVVLDAYGMPDELCLNAGLRHGLFLV